MDSMGKAIDSLSFHHENILLVEDARESNTSVTDFCDMFILSI